MAVICFLEQSSWGPGLLELPDITLSKRSYETAIGEYKRVSREGWELKRLLKAHVDESMHMHA